MSPRHPVVLAQGIVVRALREAEKGNVKKVKMWSVVLKRLVRKYKRHFFAVEMRGVDLFKPAGQLLLAARVGAVANLFKPDMSQKEIKAALRHGARAFSRHGLALQFLNRVPLSDEAVDNFRSFDEFVRRTEFANRDLRRMRGEYLRSRK